MYEDPKAPIEARVKNLLDQMTLEEKSCQMATLYGYGRVLKDSLPTPAWKEVVWKDGIANIDEQLNGVGGGSKRSPHLIYPFSNHAKAINQIQRWFVEETRLGISVVLSGSVCNREKRRKLFLLCNLKTCKFWTGIWSGL